MTSAEPDVVTMENVPRLQSTTVFADFIRTLEGAGYEVDWRSCYGPNYGLAQTRRRLVLLASRLGPIEVPSRSEDSAHEATVRTVIQDLPAITAGGVDPNDPLHTARHVSELNLQRLQASRPGGTWEDWPDELLADCHRRPSGRSFKNVYARMSWDSPGPTITTLAQNFGTGRFGHPEQDRAISLREAALLQGFPSDYAFVPEDEAVQIAPLGRLIGNAVPPALGRAIGNTIVEHVKTVAL